jgi:DNA polymerase III alpha subunit
MKSLSTELNDRILRFDGVSIVSPEQVNSLFLQQIHPSNIRVSEETAEIVQYNSFVTEVEKLKVLMNEPIKFKYDWQLPQEFCTLDTRDFVIKAFEKKLPSLNYNDAEIEEAIDRLSTELDYFEKFGLNNLLRTIIYILNVFQKTNQIWGVGRGSSCASFVLFLLGLHVVDPIKFSVPIEEFISFDQD